MQFNWNKLALLVTTTSMLDVAFSVPSEFALFKLEINMLIFLVQQEVVNDGINLTTHAANLAGPSWSAQAFDRAFVKRTMEAQPKSKPKTKPSTKLPSTTKQHAQPPKEAIIEVPTEISSGKADDAYLERYLYNVMRLENFFNTAPARVQKYVLAREIWKLRFDIMARLDHSVYRGDELERWKTERVKSGPQFTTNEVREYLQDAILATPSVKKNAHIKGFGEQRVDYWIGRVMEDSDGYPTQKDIEGWKKYFQHLG